MVLFRMVRRILVVCFILIFFIPLSYAGEDSRPDRYFPRPEELSKYKTVLDDPRSLLDELHPSKMLPPEIWEKLHWDIQEMKDTWAEVVGFRAPEIVGKIAPEIKPGKYTYKDLEKYPGLKELMIPEVLEHFIGPGQPPFAGNIPEFEIVPTRQYYFPLPIGKLTKENMGKAKQDEKGYIIESSWSGGLPFPRPSGKFMVQQIVYNYFQKYFIWGNNYRFMGTAYGFDKHLRKDFDCTYLLDGIRLAKRVLMPPFGYYDERAKKNGEKTSILNVVFSPRDIKGTTLLIYNYEDINKFNQTMIYIPSLRRVRKMSATDNQDPINGQDLIYDDQDGFNQKLSPNRYPYKYELIAELREYLYPVSTDGTEYIDSSDGFTQKNAKFERRPVYAVRLIQQDKNYVYSKRHLYFDAETFLCNQLYFYDQKGRLYRGQYIPLGFIEESGMPMGIGAPAVQRDFIDLHTTCVQLYTPPVFWDRNHFSMRKMSQWSK